MLAEKAVELIRELSRAKDDTVPAFNEENIRRVLEEVTALFEQNQSDVSATVAGDQGLIASVHVRHAAIERNKRCLLAYLYNRLERIRQLRWEVGSVLPADIKSNLCEPEIQWFNTYNRSLAKYMRSIGDGTFPLDFTQDLVPPKSTVIKVRCLADVGEYEFDDGTQMNLKKRNVFQMPRHLVEPLIRQGILEHINAK